MHNGDGHESGAIIAKAFRRAKLFAVDGPISLPIYVNAYSGYKANERPRQLTLDEVVYEIVAVLDQWYEPSATCWTTIICREYISWWRIGKALEEGWRAIAV